MLDLALFSLPFFQRALAVGLVLSILMAILGVLVVLRKMSFFSDAIGHAALTGIALGLWLNVSPFLSALLYALLVALGIATLQRKTHLALDTLLGVFFSASVALGVILVQLTEGYQANLISFLFGDILTVSSLDLILTLIIATLTAITLTILGKPLISIAFNANLAKAEGIAVATYELVFLLVLAAVIALAIKFIGVILVTGLLIIPAASAQNLARSLGSMFVISTIISVASVTVGMLTSAALNTTSGPTIILAATVFFVLSLFIRPLLITSR